MPRRRRRRVPPIAALPEVGGFRWSSLGVPRWSAPHAPPRGGRLRRSGVDPGAPAIIAVDDARRHRPARRSGHAHRLAHPRHHRTALRARTRRPGGRPHHLVRLPRRRSRRSPASATASSRTSRPSSPPGRTSSCSTTRCRTSPRPTDCGPSASRRCCVTTDRLADVPRLARLLAAPRRAGRSGRQPRPAVRGGAGQRHRHWGPGHAQRARPRVGPAADRHRRGQLPERTGRARRGPERL